MERRISSAWSRAPLPGSRSLRPRARARPCARTPPRRENRTTAKRWRREGGGRRPPWWGEKINDVRWKMTKYEPLQSEETHRTTQVLRWSKVVRFPVTDSKIKALSVTSIHSKTEKKHKYKTLKDKLTFRFTSFSCKGLKDFFWLISNDIFFYCECNIILSAAHLYNLTTSSRFSSAVKWKAGRPEKIPESCSDGSTTVRGWRV